MTDASFAAALELLRREVDTTYEQVRELPVTPTVTVEHLRREVAARFALDTGQPLAEVVATASDLLRRYSLHVTHPRYFGLFNPSVHPSGIVADALVALFNPQVGGWTHGPAANEMERLVLQRLTRSLGLNPDVTAAHFTSGGNEANHTAVLAALAHRHADWATGGVRALARLPLIYVSRESHHSFLKVARASGLGLEALRHIDVDAALRMRPDALQHQVVQDRAAGLEPMMLVATAGTTGAGAIDPLDTLADVAVRHGLWYHVDAAWGGAAALVPRLRPHLAGIERADSVTWDAHKWLSVPLGAGIVFTRHPESLARAFGVDTGYVPPTIDGGVDLYKTSMQWSRRFIGLKLLFAFAEHGESGLAAFIDTQARIGDLIRERLTSEGWRVVNQTPFPLVCFTHPSLGTDEGSTKALVQRVLERGRVWISDVTLPGVGWALRACVTSFRTNAEDVDVLVRELQDAL
ncbi:MAG: pyridoxal phosphate-dependent decarboxylase family protein [Gemmatimonadaceae bacterium]